MERAGVRRLAVACAVFCALGGCVLVPEQLPCRNVGIRNAADNPLPWPPPAPDEPASCR